MALPSAAIINVRFDSDFSTTELQVSRFHPAYVGRSDGNSIAGLTVERVELLKTIVARRSCHLDRHSS